MTDEEEEKSVPLKTLAVCSEVDALLEAARVVWSHYDKYDPYGNGVRDEELEALGAAVKPFEDIAEVGLRARDQLHELREAAADVCDHVLTSHECSHGEVIDRLAAVLAKILGVPAKPGAT